MKKQKDYTITALLFVFALAFIGSGAACKLTRQPATECPFEGLECPNAQDAAREYQIELGMDSTYIYDGDRLVGVLPYDSTQSFDKIMMKDNE